MIGIIGAMQIEVDNICALIVNKKIDKISGIDFVSGQIENRDVVVAKCGVGKVFAAICAQTMCLEFSPSLIINVGVGGSLSENLGIGDIAIASAAVQHDMDTTPLGEPKGFLSGIDIVEIPSDSDTVKSIEEIATALNIHHETGLIASGDQFIGSVSQKRSITADFCAIACEMEGAAIAQTAYLNRVPFCIIRAISDDADGNAAESFPSFAVSAAENSARLVTEFVKKRGDIL